MTAPTVEAAIHELMDLAWNVVYDLLEERGLLGDGLEVGEYTGIQSWLDGPIWCVRLRLHDLVGVGGARQCCVVACFCLHDCSWQNRRISA